MKATIVLCIKEIIEKKFGKDKFKEILKKSGFEEEKVFFAAMDIEDDKVLKIVDNAIKILNVNKNDFFELFGEYWVTGYATKIYKPYFLLSSNAKEFLSNMKTVHELVTKISKSSNPPDFEYEKRSNEDNKLIMHYKSKRGLSFLMPGLIKGVAKHYNESVDVKELGNDTFEITFKG